jgi:hypothetical protein
MALVHERAWSADARLESGWYFPIRPLWDRFADAAQFPSAAALSEVYAHEVAAIAESLPLRARGLRFAETGPKVRRPRDSAVELASLYEGRIVERGEVPTRANDWHDLFNALTFCAFPRAKWALHERQYRLLKSRLGPDTRRLPGARTREQDALTLFDEGGIAVVMEPADAAELARSELALGEAVLALYQGERARLVPFGHALYEHMVEGLACPFGTLHVVSLPLRAWSTAALLRALDAALSDDLAAPTQFVQPSPARGLSLSAIAHLA